MKTETVEHFAQVCLTAHQLGGAKRLGKIELEKLQLARTRYKRNASAEPCKQ
jgi:L-fuculose-phosphate aldolase